MNNNDMNFHIGMTPAQVEELPNDLDVLTQAWHLVNNIFCYPVITEEEIMELEIPEGSMYVPFFGILDGVPSAGRVTKDREGNRSFHVDVRYDTNRLNTIQFRIEQRIGRLSMMDGLV